MTLLLAENLRKAFHTRNREVKALDDVSFAIAEGECLAVVGETGSGKSTLGKAVLGLQELDSGTITFRGDPWLGGWASSRSHHRLDIQPVFQNPRQSLNPRRRVSDALRQALRVRGERSSAEAVKELLDRVGLAPDRYFNRLPRELSGGEAQRVAIARALALRPALIVADEPTSALDVSLRAGVLNLLQDLQRDKAVAVLLVTHDMLVAREMSTQMIVMRHGRVIDSGSTRRITSGERVDPYTSRLIAAVPTLS